MTFLLSLSLEGSELKSTIRRIGNEALFILNLDLTMILNKKRYKLVVQLIEGDQKVEKELEVVTNDLEKALEEYGRNRFVVSYVVLKETPVNEKPLLLG